jgi:hypothetical protein
VGFHFLAFYEALAYRVVGATQGEPRQKFSGGAALRDRIARL